MLHVAGRAPPTRKTTPRSRDPRLPKDPLRHACEALAWGQGCRGGVRASAWPQDISQCCRPRVPRGSHDRPWARLVASVLMLGSCTQTYRQKKEQPESGIQSLQRHVTSPRHSRGRSSRLPRRPKESESAEGLRGLSRFCWMFRPETWRSPAQRKSRAEAARQHLAC